MGFTLDKYLEDLERRLSPETEETLLAEWKKFLDGASAAEIFSPRRNRAAPPACEWPAILINDAIAAPEKMLLRELKACSDTLAAASGNILTIRANYGTGILSSLFGARLFFMERNCDTLPTTEPMLDSPDAVKKLLDKGVPDARAGLGAAVLDTTAFFLSRLKPYPNAGRYVRGYHPDIQGPADICELLCGSNFFLLLIDESRLMQELLALVTRTYAAFLREWTRLVPFDDEYNAHWGFLHKGRIVLRDDSAMNLSPEMFDEFVRPYDQALLDAFSGGVIHFCGRGDHYIKSMCAMRGLTAINLSQPHLNDMEEIYRNTVDKGVKLLNFSRETAEQALRKGRPLRGNVHCAW